MAAAPPAQAPLGAAQHACYCDQCGLLCPNTDFCAGCVDLHRRATDPKTHPLIEFRTPVHDSWSTAIGDGREPLSLLNLLLPTGYVPDASLFEPAGDKGTKLYKGVKSMLGYLAASGSDAAAARQYEGLIGGVGERAYSAAVESSIVRKTAALDQQKLVIASQLDTRFFRLMRRGTLQMAGKGAAAGAAKQRIDYQAYVPSFDCLCLLSEADGGFPIAAVQMKPRDADAAATGAFSAFRTLRNVRAVGPAAAGAAGGAGAGAGAAAGGARVAAFQALFNLDPLDAEFVITNTLAGDGQESLSAKPGGAAGASGAGGALVGMRPGGVMNLGAAENDVAPPGTIMVELFPAKAPARAGDAPIITGGAIGGGVILPPGATAVVDRFPSQRSMRLTEAKERKVIKKEDGSEEVVMAAVEVRDEIKRSSEERIGSYVVLRVSVLRPSAEAGAAIAARWAVQDVFLRRSPVLPAPKLAPVLAAAAAAAVGGPAADAGRPRGFGGGARGGRAGGRGGGEGGGFLGRFFGGGGGAGAAEPEAARGPVRGFGAPAGAAADRAPVASRSVAMAKSGLGSRRKADVAGAAREMERGLAMAADDDDDSAGEGEAAEAAAPAAAAAAPVGSERLRMMRPAVPAAPGAAAAALAPAPAAARPAPRPHRLDDDEEEAPPPMPMPMPVPVPVPPPAVDPAAAAAAEAEAKEEDDRIAAAAEADLLLMGAHVAKLAAGDALPEDAAATGASVAAMSAAANAADAGFGFVEIKVDALVGVAIQPALERVLAACEDTLIARIAQLEETAKKHGFVGADVEVQLNGDPLPGGVRPFVSDRCVVCFDDDPANPVDCLFLPCGHQCLHYAEAGTLRACPICRRGITARLCVRNNRVVSREELRAEPPRIRFPDRFDRAFRRDGPMQMVARKPIVYLYPRDGPVHATVRVDLAQAAGAEAGAASTRMTALLPSPAEWGGVGKVGGPSASWRVTAHTDGTLVPQRGGAGAAPAVSSLFWEATALHGLAATGAALPKAATACIRGSAAGDWLLRALPLLGLTPREYMEMATFWAPKMVEHEWVLLHFTPRAAYEAAAPLTVDVDAGARPDCTIRVFLLWAGAAEQQHGYLGAAEALEALQQSAVATAIGEEAAEFAAAAQTVAARRAAAAFAVVEWGGSELPLVAAVAPAHAYAHAHAHAGCC